GFTRGGWLAVRAAAGCTPVARAEAVVPKALGSGRRGRLTASNTFFPPEGSHRQVTSRVAHPFPMKGSNRHLPSPAAHGRLILALALVAYAALAIGYLTLTPIWQNPDEPAHYNYVAFIAQTGGLPELRP